MQIQISSGSTLFAKTGTSCLAREWLTIDFFFVVVVFFVGEGGMYCNNPKYWDNNTDQSVDPDQTPQNAESDQSLLCLPYIQQYLRHING